MTEHSKVFENLLYCINTEPRLFRWNKGFIEWADIFTPNDWHVLPGQGRANWKWEVDFAEDHATAGHEGPHRQQIAQPCSFKWVDPFGETNHCGLAGNHKGDHWAAWAISSPEAEQ